MSHTMRVRMASGDLLEFPLEAEGRPKTDNECADKFFNEFDWAMTTLVIGNTVMRTSHIESIDFIGGPQGG